MNKVLLSILVILPLFLISCQKTPSTEVTEVASSTTENTTATYATAVTESTTAVQTLPEEVVVDLGVGFAYQSDLDQYDPIAAIAFYQWRQNGNPDPLSSPGVPYQNREGGFTIEPLQSTYFATDMGATWGIDIISISDDITILGYAPELNMDKKIDGQWVRQALLDPDRVYEGRAYRVGSATLKENLLNEEFTISPSEAAVAIDAGEYRFIFYVYVKQDGKEESRMYYIPFEVVE